MRSPETVGGVRVLGKPIAVVRKRAASNTSWGEWEDKKRRITVYYNGVWEDFYETLQHEIIHAISDELVLDLKEEQVRRLSAVLFAVYMENGWFVKEG